MLHDPDLLTIQEVRTKVEKAWAAGEKYRSFGQAQVDAIVERMAEAARGNAAKLAAMAVEETGYGNAADKLAKNLLAAELLPQRLRGMKTVGVLRELAEERITEIAAPFGVVAAVLPTTNPTSTAIYKSLIALKAGNAIVISPHPRAKGCTCATVEILYRAAIAAGAPEGLLQCLTQPTLEATNTLMRHPKTAVILATGGGAMVKAAYASGKPAYGVGPGNVPVLIDTSADVDAAVGKLLSGKSFDHGTLCSSEQTVVAETSRREAILRALAAQRAHVCTPEQTRALERVLFSRGTAVNPELVGHSAAAIAQAAGFTIASGVRVLACEIGGIGKEHPLSAEKLSPVLALRFVAGWPEALAACEAVLRFHGLGHTCGIYTQDEARAREYGLRMPAHRILVNSPTPQGSVGITTNLFPAMTLGCGAVAGNSTGDNVTPLHLLNIKRVAWAVREPHEALPSLGQPAAASAGTGGGPVTKDRVIAAVERVLTARGVTQAPSPTASIVDRFLARRGAAAAPPAVPAAAEPATVQTAPAPRPAIVDFVCENDVREAIRHGRKIHICPKTIVTPAARDLAGQERDEVLILNRSDKGK
ncbi:MAG: aldehyde dehydrogenase family protein [Acidobacteriaceae bacterium]|nr:aldehyde dehydrogenase family protein [Acidobacteriaceae bacterium]